MVHYLESGTSRHISICIGSIVIQIERPNARSRIVIPIAADKRAQRSQRRG